MQTLRIQTPPTRLPLSSANEDSPSLKASLFPLRVQRFNRLGLCNPLGENQPSLSRRSELFAVLRSPTASPILRSAIFRHSAEVNPFSRSRIKKLFAGALFPIARAPWVGSWGEVTIG